MYYSSRMIKVSVKTRLVYVSDLITTSSTSQDNATFTDLFWVCSVNTMDEGGPRHPGRTIGLLGDLLQGLPSLLYKD